MIICDMVHLNQRAGTYVLFGSDRRLYLAQAGGLPVPIIHLPGIDTKAKIKLYVHEPWVCVTERFGTHAVLVHLENASVREMCREDYHANVSSYSVGFLERNGRTLLIHQTEWNRLDIMDAITGECLTAREIDRIEKEPGHWGEDDEWVSPIYEEKNYIDYFHSLLHVSPNGEYFLSNGWIWTPIGQIICFRSDDFIKRYEQSNVSIDYSSTYNWDRPCAFIDDNRFVIAVDDMHKSDQLDDADLKSYHYKQLLSYRLDIPVAENQYGELALLKEREVYCSAFKPDKEGYVHGELVWDAEYGFLVAITPDGAFAINLDGQVLKSMPDCNAAK